MVKSGSDSDARSDSSEKEIELDVRGGVADRPGAVGALPLVTPMDDERVGEWKMDVKSSSSKIEGKLKEMDEGGDQVQTAVVMHVAGEVVDFIRSGHELEEEEDVVGEALKNAEEQEQNDVLASENPKGDRDTAIADLSDADSVTSDVDILNNKKQNGLEKEFMAIEDWKGI